MYIIPSTLDDSKETLLAQLEYCQEWAGDAFQANWEASRLRAYIVDIQRANVTEFGTVADSRIDELVKHALATTTERSGWKS